MSDGGGDLVSIALESPTAVVSLCALVVSVVVALTSARRQRRAELRSAVESALASLISPEVSAARVFIVQVARGEHFFRHESPIDGNPEGVRRSNEEVLELTDRMRAASLTLMWAVQALQPRLSPFMRRRLMVSKSRPWLRIANELRSPSAVALRAQLVAIMTDLDRALDGYGLWFDWRIEGELTNASLDEFPFVRSGGWMLGPGEIPRLDLTASGNEESIVNPNPVRYGNEFGQRRREQAAIKEAKDRAWEETRAKWAPRIKVKSEDEQ